MNLDEMDEDEDDIWDYKPIKKVKISCQKTTKLQRSDEKQKDTQTRVRLT